MVLPPVTSTSERPRPTVYFDGACPVCRREIAHYRQGSGEHALNWVDAAACPPGDLGPALSRPQALARLHLRLPDGQLVHGAAAFLAMWAALPDHPRLAAWARRLNRPAVVAVLDAAYSAFLRVRRLWRRAA
ncbi:thiol-disulfide oxidoreductase DCC family protein [Roseateles sp. BYS87W]|uniref:Thiol-disulfide oxidoreductase DCC family protein n=1 Tax=Pelomonas baiyunensis TaxID=3299026 RepID=A0ABW7GTW1_9BURK